MLEYAILLNCAKSIDINIVELLKGKDLNYHALSEIGLYSPIELAIRLRRIDIVKLLVESGADPISPEYKWGIKIRGVPQIFYEYHGFGTNHYISWLLNEHIKSEDLPAFIEKVLDSFNPCGVNMSDAVGRHSAHAILTCGHEKMIARFLECHGSAFLNAKDDYGKGKCALYISAEKGDLESVKILFKMM